MIRSVGRAPIVYVPGGAPLVLQRDAAEPLDHFVELLGRPIGAESRQTVPGIPGPDLAVFLSLWMPPRPSPSNRPCGP